jgi:ubiquinone/menaquinone biosynthesis C-methylase UbiE
MAQQISFETYGGNAAENYERYFVPTIGAPLAADLVDLAALSKGERVVDIACGTGVVTRLAAERVGADGAVAGVDINPGMLAVARAATFDSTIEWHQASAEALAFPDDSYNVAFCQMGLQFFPEKATALQEMRRVPRYRGARSAQPPRPDAADLRRARRSVGPSSRCRRRRLHARGVLTARRG